MRMVIVCSSESSETRPARAIVCHDVRHPERPNEILVRKGTPLNASDLAPLLAQGVAELHLAVPEPGDMDENEAATRLAAAVVGPGVEPGDAHYGQVTFTSALRGVLRIDSTRLSDVNALDGVLLATAEADRPVDVGDAVGVVKCAPLLLPESTLQTVERAVTRGRAVLEVEPFQSMWVAFVAPRDRLRGGAFDRAHAALSHALAWYGSTLDPVIGAEATTDGMAAAYRQALNSGADLIFAAGASGTDPLDVVFEGLRRAGGSVDQIGIPAEPGTACWVGNMQSTPVLGLASCELFGKPGALDLLLPRLLTGEPLDRELVRRLAPGGFLNGPSRIARYHD